MQHMHAKPYASQAGGAQAYSPLWASQGRHTQDGCAMKPAVCQQEPSPNLAAWFFHCLVSALQSNPIGAALRAREAAVVAGEGQCRTLFVHAGLLPAVLQRAAGEAGLNDAMAATPEKLLAALQQTVSGEPGPPAGLCSFAPCRPFNKHLPPHPPHLSKICSDRQG